MSIRRKLTLVIMLTSSASLLLACAAFFFHDITTYREELVEQATSLGQVIGNSCTAAVDFSDEVAAGETLAALQGEHSVAAAFVFMTDGTLFASYQREGIPAMTPPAPGRNRQYHFTRDNLVLSQPMIQSGARIGTLVLVLDLAELAARLQQYVVIVMIVFLASLFVAFVITNRLQRLVSIPIQGLARAARSVAARKDYALRARKQGDDEIGQLVDAFNEMLTQIQSRDAALEAARNTLELRVEERTRELVYERDLFQTLMESFPDSIYFKDRQSRFVRVNRAKLESSYAFCLEQHRSAYPEGNVLPGHLSTLERFSEYLIGRTDAEFLPEADERPVFELEQQVIRTGQPILGRLDQVRLRNGKTVWYLSSKMPWRDGNGNIIGIFGTSKDISSIKEAEAQMQALHQQLLDTSRRAGMAEVATSVLHNVGNVLNSVNVSASVIEDLLRRSKTPGIRRLADLFEEKRGDLAGFLSRRDRADHTIRYLQTIAEQVATEQEQMLRELRELTGNIEHIKEIVVMQQNHARISGVTETVQLSDLVEDSLRMNSAAFSRHNIRLIRDYQSVPAITIEKHKVLQVLVNLIRNAKYACEESNQPDRQITVRVASVKSTIQVSVIDNGVGIAPENLTRIFGHGFTTRKNGHGFGLHSGALAAREMGGALHVHSDGPGKGAAFTLELPLPEPCLSDDGGATAATAS
jgi:signal transduction histidine kinase/HAMP domain-containing protein